jgi:uridine monophosphate synthetase
VGAQGGDLEAALRAGLRDDGMGMLIPVSRGISRAENPRDAAIQLKDTINKARETIRTHSEVSPAEIQPSKFSNLDTQLADALLELECVKFGEFTLKSGQSSPIYIDLRRLVADPNVLAMAADAFIPILQQLAFDHLAALPYAAMPIGSAISLRGGWPMIYPRKEVKSYGTKAQIEGVYKAGERAVVIDDLITTGGSKLEGIEKLTEAGLEVSDIVVLINRQSSGANFMAEHGYKLHSVFMLALLLDYWEESGKVDSNKIGEVRAFLRQQA